jgi:hypothetical protein
MKKTGCPMLDGVVIVPRRDGKSLPCKRLEEDNAKLLALAADMWPYAKAFMDTARSMGVWDTKSYDWQMQLIELGADVS